MRVAGRCVEGRRGESLPGKLGRAEGGSEVGGEEDEEGEEDDDDATDGEALPEIRRIVCEQLLFPCHHECPQEQLYGFVG